MSASQWLTPNVLGHRKEGWTRKRASKVDFGIGYDMMLRIIPSFPSIEAKEIRSMNNFILTYVFNRNIIVEGCLGLRPFFSTSAPSRTVIRIP